jgi:type VI protein secretion system component VasF
MMPGGANVALSVHCGSPTSQAAAPAASAAATAGSAKPNTTPGTALPDWLVEATAKVIGALLLIVVLLTLAAAFGARHTGLRYSSYWGGFGGSGTGWQITPAAVNLLAAGLLAAVALVMLALLLQSAAQLPDDKAQTKPAPPAASATKA